MDGTDGTDGNACEWTDESHSLSQTRKLIPTANTGAEEALFKVRQFRVGEPNICEFGHYDDRLGWDADAAAELTERTAHTRSSSRKILMSITCSTIRSPSSTPPLTSVLSEHLTIPQSRVNVRAETQQSLFTVRTRSESSQNSGSSARTMSAFARCLFFYLLVLVVVDAYRLRAFDQTDEEPLTQAIRGRKHRRPASELVSDSPALMSFGQRVDSSSR